MDWLKNRLSESSVDFVGKRRFAAILSTIGVLLSWGVFLGVGPQWGIDFTGGTEVHLRFDDGIGIAELRGALDELDIPNDSVQEFGDGTGHEFKIRIKDPEFGADAVKAEVRGAIEEAFGSDWLAPDGFNFNAEVGARIQVKYTGERISTETLSRALEDLDGLKVEAGRDDRELVIKLPGLAGQVEDEIAAAMAGRDFDVVQVTAVGPKVGEALRQQGATSLIATLALVLVYVAFRFDIAFAPGAIVALIHDVSLTVGAFVLLGKEFNLPMIGALLTIVGYSLNDTIVIYDRIRENRERYRREDLPELINVSINETLARTVATSVTTFFAISAFLFIGSPVIRDFVLAMLCGIVFGTYSTIFVASPMIMVMDKVKPKLAALIAVPDLETEDDIPDEFLSESERRRRERERLQAEAERQDETVG